MASLLLALWQASGLPSVLSWWSNESPPIIYPSHVPGKQDILSWYDGLLDHDQVRDDPLKVQLVYSNQRDNHQKTCREYLLGTPVPPAKTTISVEDRLLRRIEAQARGENVHISEGNLNCFGIWARPSHEVLELLVNLQSQLKQLLGDDIWLTEPGDMHLSILELSHLKTLSTLESHAETFGSTLLQEMVDLLATLCGDGKHVYLVRPRINFDKSGFALSFLPAPGGPASTDAYKYTYHHLRRDLCKMSLGHGVNTDTCYSALTAHVTLARFISSKTLEDTNFGDEQTKHAAKMQQFVNDIDNINATLRDQFWKTGDEWNWKVGQDNGLQIVLGDVRYGLPSSLARFTGKPVAQG